MRERPLRRRAERQRRSLGVRAPAVRQADDRLAPGHVRRLGPHAVVLAGGDPQVDGIEAGGEHVGDHQPLRALGIAELLDHRGSVEFVDDRRAHGARVYVARGTI
jgi:hypothetical protein